MLSGHSVKTLLSVELNPQATKWNNKGLHLKLLPRILYLSLSLYF